MTVDDENSIYVGGLPYEFTESDLRHHFEMYGAVIDVKIINDRKVGGKCFGFITFTNPKSAIDAIQEMDGRTIGGRIVRVNEVHTRGGRPHYGRENFHRDFGRDRGGEWGRGRDRERGYGRERIRYRDRSHDRDRDKEMESEQEHSLDVERDRDYEDGRRDFNREHERDSERDHGMDWENETEKDRSKGYDSGKEKEKERHHRESRSSLKGRESRELSSSSSDDHGNRAKLEQIRDQLDKTMERHEELQKEVAQIKDKVDEKEQLVVELQKKSQKLRDAFTAAQKVTLHRQSLLSKIHRCYLQVQDYTEKSNQYQKELQSLAEDAMDEIEKGDEAGVKDGPAYADARA